MADDSRIELQLRALNGEDVVVPYPQSRVEKLLYKMNGYDIELDPPQSRVEELLKEYIDNGGGGGGGGSSDFSIAHVTLINTSQDGYYYTVNCPRIYLDYLEFATEDVNAEEPSVLDVVLYKGDQFMGAGDWDNSIAPVITGDITYDSEEGTFIIKGDGSISLVGTGRIM